ncbi:hypothetical protein Q1695_015805 [Nippostrongylus brasiliensis]|nr:hypothetical protein Q1695_015805 [Nippostrongylus brasiliensis]
MSSSVPMEIPAVRKKSAEMYLHDYDLDDDLSIASPPTNRNVANVYDPVDALSANREQTRLVAAGCRGVLKVFKIDDEGLEEVIDLRSVRSRRLNLLYSPSNVSWSKLKDELVATTSNNGAVVLWDVHKGKIEMHYKAHQRSATVVHFHRSNENLLVSGSRDAAVFLYDLRQQEPVSKFGGTNSYDDIRDLSFCIHQDQHDQFVTSGDSGTIRLWDTRKGEKPLIQFPAHQGYAASIALNPRERHLIASGGGRDKFIKIWNWSGTRPTAPTYQVETMAPVGRVYWSPDAKNAFHIASCAVVNDMSVHIWDIRRPYLPYASFEGHSDSVTDMWWSMRNPERIVSCGKDGLLVLHRMEQKQSPLSYACDMALDVAPDGLVGVAANSHIPIIKQQEHYMARKRQPYDPFRTPVRSQLSCGLPDNAMNTLQPSAFYKLAERYLSGGRPIRVLCNHNANLAVQVGQSSVAQSWRLVGALLEQTGLQKVYDMDAKEAVTAFKEKYNKYVSEMERHGKKVPEPPRTLALLPTYLTRFSATHSNLHNLRKEARLSPTSNEQFSEFVPSNVASGDFYFGAGELTKTAVEKGIENPHYNDFTGLKDEAFALKPDLTKLMFMSMPSDDEKHLEKEHTARMNWNPMQEVARLLRYHADQGDMQTCATIALVCGRRLSDVIDDYTVEAWKESYIGMLDQLDLHNAIAGVKKYTWIKRVNQRSLEGTHFRLSHRGCTGQALKCRCIKCYAVCGGSCSVCDGPLLEMNWFCRKCHHAGHPHHILEWFTTERVCPVADCQCQCGTTAVQAAPRKGRAQAARKKLREKMRIRESECYVPSPSVKIEYISSSDSDTDSDETVTLTQDNQDRLTVGGTKNKQAKETMPERVVREADEEEVDTEPIERELKEILQNPNATSEVRSEIDTMLYWLQCYRLHGPDFVKQIEGDDERGMSDLEAERQAYALFYQSKAKKAEDDDTRFKSDEIPKHFTELRRFMMPLGDKQGPLDAKQTSARLYYERILNGEVDQNELNEVREWEENARREMREQSRTMRKRRKSNDEVISLVSRVHLLSAISGAGLYTAWNLRRARCEALLENPWLLTPHVKPILEKRSLLINCVYLPWYLLCGSWIFLRRITRCLTLAIRFLPLAVTYPLARRMDFLHELWWTCVLYAIQSSGPTFIKLGQWASTRRDIFSKEFCDRMSVLHTKTRRQRSFRDCDQVLDEIFGENFAKNHKEEVFVQIEPYSIGSGCIAQVYKGTVNVPALEKVTGRKIPQLEGLVEREVAIKVAERGVEDKINLDLSILRNATSLVLRILPSLGYLEPLSALDQFEMVLRRQVDLRNEARALQKFTENFDHKKTGVKFPIVLGYTKNAIVETFEHGMYINRLVAEEHDPELAARQSPRVRRRIALLGARALLKMIFVDNFVHGDLHPGNILIRFNDDQEKLPGVHNAPPRESLLARFVEVVRDLIGWRDVPRVRFTDSPDLADEPTLVMLDTGIVVSETEKNLRNLKALFRAIIEKQGYKAGELLLTHAENSRNCVDPHQFCLQVDELVKKAMKEKSLRSLNISGLLSEMFSLVAAHRVYLDSSFTSVVLSVMVLEGFGRSLDPDLDLFQCARPYLLNMV